MNESVEKGVTTDEWVDRVTTNENHMETSKKVRDAVGKKLLEVVFEPIGPNGTTIYKILDWEALQDFWQIKSLMSIRRSKPYADCNGILSLCYKENYVKETKHLKRLSEKIIDLNKGNKIEKFLTKFGKAVYSKTTCLKVLCDYEMCAGNTCARKIVYMCRSAIKRGESAEIQEKSSKWYPQLNDLCVMKQHIDDFYKRVDKKPSEGWFDNIGLKYTDDLFDVGRRKNLEYHCANISNWELLEGYGDKQKIARFAAFLKTLLEIANKQQQHAFNFDVAYSCLCDSFGDPSLSRSLSKESKESSFRKRAGSAHEAVHEIYAWASKKAKEIDYDDVGRISDLTKTKKVTALKQKPGLQGRSIKETDPEKRCKACVEVVEISQAPRSEENAGPSHLYLLAKESKESLHVSHTCKILETPHFQRASVALETYVLRLLMLGLKPAAVITTIQSDSCKLRHDDKAKVSRGLIHSIRRKNNLGWLHPDDAEDVYLRCKKEFEETGGYGKDCFCRALKNYGVPVSHSKNFGLPEGKDFPASTFLMIHMDHQMVQDARGAVLVFVDETHNISCSENYKLATLMTRGGEDDTGKEIAFIIANEWSETTYVYAFEIIKNVIEDERNGPLPHREWKWQPKAVMSDMAEAAPNGLESALGFKLPFRLFCTWHCIKAVGRSVREKAIGDSNLLSSFVLTKFRACMYAYDQGTFENLWHDLIAQLVTKNEEEIVAYLKQKYQRKESWALCFRNADCLRDKSGRPARTNMILEAFHRTLKWVILGGRRNKRVGLFIEVLRTRRCMMHFSKYRLENDFCALPPKARIVDENGQYIKFFRDKQAYISRVMESGKDIDKLVLSCMDINANEEDYLQEDDDIDTVDTTMNHSGNSAVSPISSPRDSGAPSCDFDDSSSFGSFGCVDDGCGDDCMDEQVTDENESSLSHDTCSGDLAKLMEMFFQTALLRNESVSDALPLLSSAITRRCSTTDTKRSSQDGCKNDGSTLLKTILSLLFNEAAIQDTELHSELTCMLGRHYFKRMVQGEAGQRCSDRLSIGTIASLLFDQALTQPRMRDFQKALAAKFDVLIGKGQPPKSNEVEFEYDGANEYFIYRNRIACNLPDMHKGTLGRVSKRPKNVLKQKRNNKRRKKEPDSLDCIPSFKRAKTKKDLARTRARTERIRRRELGKFNGRAVNSEQEEAALEAKFEVLPPAERKEHCIIQQTLDKIGQIETRNALKASRFFFIENRDCALLAPERCEVAITSEDVSHKWWNDDCIYAVVTLLNLSSPIVNASAFCLPPRYTEPIDETFQGLLKRRWTKWKQSGYDTDQNFFKRMDRIKQASVIAMPANITHTHWYTLVAHKQYRKDSRELESIRIVIHESLKTSENYRKANHHKKAAELEHLIRFAELVHPGSQTLPEANTGATTKFEVQECNQRDSFSCGPCTAVNLDAVMRGNPDGATLFLKSLDKHQLRNYLHERVRDFLFRIIHYAENPLISPVLSKVWHPHGSSAVPAVLSVDNSDPTTMLMGCWDRLRENGWNMENERYLYTGGQEPLSFSSARDVIEFLVHAELLDPSTGSLKLMDNSDPTTMLMGCWNRLRAKGWEMKNNRYLYTGGQKSLSFSSARGVIDFLVHTEQLDRSTGSLKLNQI